MGRAWDLRKNITAYDAVYVALAGRLDGTLITVDRPLAAAARRFTRVAVEAPPS